MTNSYILTIIILEKLKIIVARKIDNCYNINVKIKEQRTALQMNKIAETIDTVYIYIYIYITDFNLIKNLYKYKTIFSCAFLRNSKMYV